MSLNKFLNLLPFNDLKKLFFKNELNVFFTRKNYLLVIGFAFLAIAAIGFSSGSIDYLQKEMRSPFVYQITADPPRSRTKTPLEYLREGTNNYNDLDSMQKYQYSSIYKYMTFSEIIVGVNHRVAGRTVVHSDSTLMDVILDAERKLVGHGFDFGGHTPYLGLDQTNNYGVIITESLLNRLPCDQHGQKTLDSPPFIQIDTGDDYAIINIPILAVVTELPDNVDILVEDYYFDNVNQEARRFFQTDPSLTSKNLHFMIDLDPSRSSGQIVQIRDSLIEAKREWNEDNPFRVNIDKIYAVETFKKAFRPTVLVTYRLESSVDRSTRHAIFENIKHHSGHIQRLSAFDIDSHSIIKFYNPDRVSFEHDEAERDKEREHLAINFDELDYVRDFRDSFQENTGLMLEMSRIHQMEHYQMVVRLLTVIALVLVVFAVLAIILYVHSVVDTYLSGIRTNIGTYLAFGVSIQKVYIALVFLFIISAELLGLILVSLIGYFGTFGGILSLFYDFEAHPFFGLGRIVDWVYLAIIFLVPPIAIFYLSIRKIFKQSPGDLVYNRNIT